VPQPVLYVHGTRDGCFALDVVALDKVKVRWDRAPRSRSWKVSVTSSWPKKPEDTHQRIVGFLKRAWDPVKPPSLNIPANSGIQRQLS
jgi:hypothetical protein